MTMNCQAVQNQILALPDPRHVPDSLRDHVAGCDACRAWARRAARLEGSLERLPAPPAPAGRKARFLAELTGGGPTFPRHPAAPETEPATGLLPFVRRNAALVGGLAAAALVALGWWAIGNRNGNTPEVATRPAPEHPFLKKVVKRDVAMARATTPTDRLRELAGLADDLSAEARAMARIAGAAELQDLAAWYDKVVRDGVVRQAAGIRDSHAVPLDERARLLGEAARGLGEAAAEAEKLLGEVPPDAKPALQRIADSAREGQKKLRG